MTTISFTAKVEKTYKFKVSYPESANISPEEIQRIVIEAVDRHLPYESGDSDEIFHLLLDETESEQEAGYSKALEIPKDRINALKQLQVEAGLRNVDTSVSEILPVVDVF